uniref:Ubiquitin-like domain-containing protein n=1 Tax=Oryzias latipes TaxID=8090 RepID=A0A3B3I9V4_ORYLA
MLSVKINKCHKILVSIGHAPFDVRSSRFHGNFNRPTAETADRNLISMGKIYQVVVHGLRGEKMVIDLCNTEEQMQKMTVLQLKEKIAQRLPESAGEESLRLIFTDKMLDTDSKLLSEYGIQNLSVIHMVIKVPGGL